MRKAPVLLILLSIFNLECAQIKHYNAPGKSSLIKMKRVELTFLNGNTVKMDDVILDTENGVVFSSDLNNKFTLTEMKSLKFSNTNLGPAGFLSVSIAATYLIMKKNGSSSSRIGDMTIGTPAAFFAGVTGAAIGYVGYAVGKEFHRNWQEFDLTPYRRDK